MGGGGPGRAARRGPACLWVTLALAWGAGSRAAAGDGDGDGEPGLGDAGTPCGAEGWARAAVPPGPAFVAAASYRGPGNNDTRSNKALPILLWWSGSLFPHFPGDTERIDCPRGSCLVTRSRRAARHRRTKALIFYGTDFRAYEAPLPRLPHQTWALFHEESPMNNYLLSHPPGIRLFNYTATFRRESDYPLTLQWLPGAGYLRGPALPLAEKDAWRRRGYGPVLYMQSHCDVPSDRDRYVRELMKYIQVDSYGKCLHNRELPSERLRDTSTATTEDPEFMAFIARYKFHLALENAICNDYMTEKLWRPMHLGAVPVYRGSPAVRDWMPNNLSIILIDDFGSPQELAKYLDFLDKNGEEYMKYLEYKNLDGIKNQFLLESLERREWGVNDMTLPNYLNGFECFICDRENARVRAEQEHKKSRGKTPAPSPHIAHFQHMGCPMPTPGFGSVEDLPGEDRDRYICRSLPLLQSALELPRSVSDRNKDTNAEAANLDRENKILVLFSCWKEMWLQDYWQSLDQGEALTAMIRHNESHQGRFWDYMHEIFLKRTRQH